VGFLDMAVVQAAVYDAVQAIDGKFKPYNVQIPGASGSPEAAAAKAAHDVLVNIFPAQGASLDTAYRDHLAKKGLAESDPGVAVGAWLDANCGSDGWTMTPSSTRGVAKDALAICFADATLASTFVARWCAMQRVEIVDGVYQVRNDEPTQRIGAALHRTP
jgi:hypothetical protein